MVDDVHDAFSLIEYRSGAGLGVLGGQSGGPQNLQQPPMCPSPSAHSDSSSGNGRLSSAGSEPGTLRLLVLRPEGIDHCSVPYPCIAVSLSLI